MRRAEARIARAAQKQLKDAEKSARLKEQPTEQKAVRLGANPGSVFQTAMTWTIDGADCGGEWSSGTVRQWSEECWSQEIQPKLNEWSKLTWAEIDNLITGNDGKRHKMHHSMPVDALLDEAQKRLTELQKVEESMFRFRLGNKPRLWGFRRVSVFHVFWHDPEHEIYPTDPS